MHMRLAQLTGIAVTAIAVFGTDFDVVTAVPFGLFAGTLAASLAMLADMKPIPIRIRRRR